MKQDKYIHSMDWVEGNDIIFSNNSNYRKYQYDLIAKYIGKNILEVGTGDGSFTSQIVNHSDNITRIISIEPSNTLLKLYKDKHQFPNMVSVCNIDLFDVHPGSFGLFDTVIFIHVLEHIENDKEVLNHTYNLLEKSGHVLIEVPALSMLFSEHDKSLGHFRRYNKKLLNSIIDNEKYKIKKIWYQDPIGVLGSLYFFKLKKIKLKSNEGDQLVKNQGSVYDKYVIPFEKYVEKFIKFPFGLSLTAILQKC
ncbi:class I SAM-dependent methyltransferase [Bacteroidota bacterium]